MTAAPAEMSAMALVLVLSLGPGVAAQCYSHSQCDQCDRLSYCDIESTCYPCTDAAGPDTCAFFGDPIDGICPSNCGGSPLPPPSPPPTLPPIYQCTQHIQCSTGAYCDAQRACYACSGCISRGGLYDDALLGLASCSSRCPAPATPPSTSPPPPPTHNHECSSHPWCRDGEYCGVDENGVRRCFRCTSCAVGNAFDGSCPAYCYPPTTPQPTYECTRHAECSSEDYCHMTGNCHNCYGCVNYAANGDLHVNGIDGYCPRCGPPTEPMTRRPTPLPTPTYPPPTPPPQRSPVSPPPQRPPVPPPPPTNSNSGGGNADPDDDDDGTPNLTAPPTPPALQPGPTRPSPSPTSSQPTYVCTGHVDCTPTQFCVSATLQCAACSSCDGGNAVGFRCPAGCDDAASTRPTPASSTPPVPPSSSAAITAPPVTSSMLPEQPLTGTAGPSAATPPSPGGNSSTPLSAPTLAPSDGGANTSTGRSTGSTDSPAWALPMAVTFGVLLCMLLAGMAIRSQRSKRPGAATRLTGQRADPVVDNPTFVLDDVDASHEQPVSDTAGVDGAERALSIEQPDYAGASPSYAGAGGYGSADDPANLLSSVGYDVAVEMSFPPQGSAAWGQQHGYSLPSAASGDPDHPGTRQDHGGYVQGHQPIAPPGSYEQSITESGGTRERSAPLFRERSTTLFAVPSEQGGTQHVVQGDEQGVYDLVEPATETRTRAQIKVLLDPRRQKNMHGYVDPPNRAADNLVGLPTAPNETAVTRNPNYRRGHVAGVVHGAADRRAADATEDGEYLTVAGVNDNPARAAAPAQPKRGIARRQDRKPSIYDGFGDDTTSAPISSNAPHFYVNGHVDALSPALFTATPTSGVGPAGDGRRCAYVSVNDGHACQHAAGGSSKHCWGHTCAHPGCYSGKSSRVEYCADHSGGTEA